jgi:glutathione synthase/RimK-type ligase-like ATP-grasp enzyme
MSVLIATCASLPAGDEDNRALVASLAQRGVAARAQVWNDPAASWADDLVVIRSTWDYTSDRDAFLAWARAVPRLENPAGVVAWNSDKTYLPDLAAAGVPVVPSTFVAPGETAALPAGEFVVKPSVGAGSMGAGRFTVEAAAAAQAHVSSLHDAGRTALIQPYLSDVDSAGETALVYVEGRFSHAVRKAAMLAPQAANPLDELASDTRYVLERIEPREPAAAELAVGRQVVELLRAQFGTDLLYARVDLLPTSAGPVVIELELTEPSLFLGHDPDAADRLAAAIVARI